jgi:hypothetical protein
MSVCLVLQQLRQQEGGDKRGYVVLGVAVVRLLDEFCVEGSGRATRDERALRQDVTLKRMRQCDCCVQREDGECVVSRRISDSTKI